MNILTFVGQVVSILIALLLYVMYNYLKHRSENWATKDDIGEITRKIEEAKLEYSKQIEEYKHEMIKKYELVKVLIDIKIEIFRSIISLKKKIILSKNNLWKNIPNDTNDMYHEMQDIMIRVATISNLEPEIHDLKHKLNIEYNKFTTYLMEVKQSGLSTFSYNLTEFELTLDTLQQALIS